jgi:hypothetical protein
MPAGSNDCRRRTSRLSIYGRFAPGHSLAQDFRQRFGADLDEETLNQSHQIIIVAASLDDSTERVVAYLSERDILSTCCASRSLPTAPSNCSAGRGCSIPFAPRSAPLRHPPALTSHGTESSIAPSATANRARGKTRCNKASSVAVAVRGTARRCNCSPRATACG